MPESLSTNEITEGILKGDRAILSRAITIVESTLEEDHALAADILDACIPKSGNSIRIGITGVPGVGKSTFIEAFGKQLTGQGKKVAVLAIDPSSQQSGGSILGDKTRMEELSRNENAYIRPSPAGKVPGGVAATTRETILLCEAAGFDTILVETVGVGQAETVVHSMVDFFLLLLLAGAGDELQGIKRGVMELADLIVINKADGDNKEKAQQARAQYQSAVQLFPARASGWVTKVETCSALNSTGIEKIWEMVKQYRQLMEEKGLFEARRQQQASFWLKERIEAELKHRFYADPVIQQAFRKIEPLVQAGKLSPYAASRQLLELFSS